VGSAYGEGQVAIRNIFKYFERLKQEQTAKTAAATVGG
jgi:hypothetical protein